MRPAERRHDHAAVPEQEARLQVDYEKIVCKKKQNNQQQNLSSYAW